MEHYNNEDQEACLNDELLTLAGEKILVLDLLNHNKRDAKAYVENHADVDVNFEEIYTALDALLDYKCCRRLHEIEQDERPYQKSEQLSEHQHNQIQVVHHESQFDEQASSEHHAQRQDLHPVALENLEGPSLVNLLVHKTVQGEKKREQASEDDVDDPQSCCTDAIWYTPVGAASFDILKAVGQGKDLVCIDGLGESLITLAIYHFTVLAQRDVVCNMRHIVKTGRRI